MTIEQLQLPILEEFRLFRQEYGRRTESEVPLLGEVESYLNTTSGKQLRPLLVLLSAKACGTMAEHHILLAAAVELLRNPACRVLRERLALGSDSRILVFSTEGATDRENYRRIVWDGAWGRP